MMTSVADGTRATKAVKKKVNNLKIFWETFQSFDEIFFLSSLLAGAVVIGGAFFTASHLLGYLLMVCASKPVVFLSYDPTGVGAVTIIALLAIFLLGTITFNTISIFLYRAKIVKERYTDAL